MKRLEPDNHSTSQGDLNIQETVKRLERCAKNPNLAIYPRSLTCERWIRESALTGELILPELLRTLSRCATKQSQEKFTLGWDQARLHYKHLSSETFSITPSTAEPQSIKQYRTYSLFSSTGDGANIGPLFSPITAKIETDMAITVQSGSRERGFGACWNHLYERR